MATTKPTFAKLGLKINNEVKTIKFNDQEIEVKQYLPVNDKLALISRVINLSSSSSYNYANPVQVDVIGTLEIIFAYSNISFTDKQKEDLPKLYDLLDSSGLANAIVEAIPADEYEFLIKGIEESIESVYQYKNSVVGFLEIIGKDYSNLSLDAEAIKANLADKKNLELVNEILTKLG